MNSRDETARLLERIARVVQNDSTSGGLNSAQWEALRYFGRANRYSRSPGSLTSYLGVTKGTVSQTVNALERKGLVRKKADKGDRRAVTVELSAKGKRLLAQDPLGQLASLVGELPAARQQALERTLSTLLKNTLARRSGQPFGVCRSCRFFERDADGGAPHRCGLLKVPLSDPDSELICREHADA